MEICSVCDSGLLVVKMSSAGKEAFCSSCRRIVESATLGFKFSAAGEDGIEPCKDARGADGVKGPGKKARCFTWMPGDKEAEAKAREKAKASAYAHQHSKGASRIAAKLAVGYFTGGPESMSAPAAASSLMGKSNGSPIRPGGNPTNPMAPGAQPNPVSPIMHPGKSPIEPGPIRPGGAGLHGEVPAAPGGMQMGDLNGANPLNSGTTASRKLIMLANELIAHEEMGDPFCTQHNSRASQCNHLHEAH